MSTSAYFKKQSNFVSVEYFGFQIGKAGKPITQLWESCLSHDGWMWEEVSVSNKWKHM